MSVKEANEITIKVTCSKEQLIKHLAKKGFSEGRKFTLDDYYLIPKNLKLDELTTREILSKAVIIRYIVDDGRIIQKITFKKKNINSNGEILSQKAINCDVLDYKAGINLFNELGYYEIMNLKESDVIYYKDKLELEIPIEKDNFFVKKAENELNKILKR